MNDDYKKFFDNINEKSLEQSYRKGCLKITYDRNKTIDISQKTSAWNGGQKIFAVGRKNNTNISRMLSFVLCEQVVLQSFIPPYYKENLFKYDCVYLFPVDFPKHNLITEIF